MMAQALGQQTQGLLESVVSIPLDQMTYVIEQNRDAGQEGLAAGLEGYVSVADELGALVSVGDAVVTETKEGYSISLPAVFEQRECEFSIDLTEDLVNIVSMSFTPVYTVSENLAKAGMNTLMGMGTVFLVLIFICWIISCMKGGKFIMKNYTITVNGNVYEVTVEEGVSTGAAPAARPAAPAPRAAAPAPAAPAAAPAPKAAAPAGAAGAVTVTAPMPGKILGVKATAGQAVKKGETIVILEAMKMENEIVAPQDGTVATINVAVGDSVESGATLATMN